MTHKARINIQVLANTGAARKEKLNGRDVLIVPSATLPDDIVMNRIKYPAAAIEKSYKQLENTPAPLGHPKLGDKYVSARDPQAININHVGAWNANVRRENGKVYLDKIIDIEVANRTDAGKALLKAIENKEQVHTSTGLIATLSPVANAADHDSEVVDMFFDHDAILLTEKGAATPAQGVGMFVNSEGASEEIDVINSSIDTADADLQWALESVARAVDKAKKAPMIERIKKAVLEMIAQDPVMTTNATEKEPTMDENKLSELLDAKFSALGTAIGEQIGNALKPLVEASQITLANQKAQEDAQKAILVEKVVKANLLSDETAKGLTINALQELAKGIPEVKAPPALASGGAIVANTADGLKAYQLPKGA